MTSHSWMWKWQSDGRSKLINKWVCEGNSNFWQYQLSTVNLTVTLLAWENSGHFETPSLVWETSAEIIFCWCVTAQYADLGSASDWSCSVGNLLQQIKRTTEIRVVTHHKYGLSALVSQVSFRNERSGVISKCRLFSHATRLLVPLGWAPVFRPQQAGLWNTHKTCWLWCKTSFHHSDDSVIRRGRLAWDKAPWWRKKSW